MSDQAPPPEAPSATALAPQPAYWQATVLMVLALLVARVAYLIFLCPYELAGDEAHYWEWSRHLQLSYYSKGPGVAYSIAGATALLGQHEWAIRLPAALFSALGALALARLTRAASGSDKAGFLAALLFCLVAAYQLTAQLATIDGPFIAFWIVASWAGWSLVERLRTGRAPVLLWLALGAALGVGFLFKYTILMLIPSLLLFAWLARRELRWDGHAVGGMLAAASAFVVAISPVIIWNARNGWPMLGHEAGHLGVGGDAGRMGWALQPAMFLEFLGGQVGIIGPPVFIACAVAVWPWLRRPRHWQADVPRLFLACCALPSLAFFLALSWLTKIEANWPAASYTTLLCLLAWQIVQREQAGLPARRRLWQGVVAWGLVTGITIWFPGWLAALPYVGRYVPMHRITGARAFAGRVQAAREELAAARGTPPLIIADSYHWASLLAFYLPDHPVVYSAAHKLGVRRSSYDFFPDTDLSAPQIRGRPAVLVGGKDARWTQALVVGSVTSLGGDRPSLFITPRYDGVRAGP